MRQQYALFPWRTAAQNVAFGPMLKRMPKPRQRETAERFLALVGLAEHGAKYPAELSGGMKQRVVIATRPGAVKAVIDVGLPPNQKVFPPDVTLSMPQPTRRSGRPRKHPVPSAPSVAVSSLFADPPDASFRTLSWRMGTKGPLRAAFSARRVRVADGPEAAGAQHLPGEERWLVCEHRTTGERKFHLASHPPETSLEQLAAAIKARWSCEQAHQQLKEELGLDHYEGRSWRGLHHHALLCQMAMAFLQSLRVGGKKARSPRSVRSTRTAAQADTARTASPHCRRPAQPSHPMPRLRTSGTLAHADMNLAE